MNRIAPDRASVERWGAEEGLSDVRILTLMVSKDGSIWIGTEGGGLNRFDPPSGQFKVYTTREGLPHDNVEGILEDDRGFLWVSTNAGLARFDPETEDFWVFREGSGLAGDRFYANSAFRSADGRLYFGGSRGLTVVDPSLIEKRNEPPPVALTGFRINEDDTPVSRALSPDGLRLKYQERFFTFSFAALDFTDPSQNRYQYRLDPLQAEWVDAGHNNVATYTSVPPGRYTFLVRARNSEGVWNEDGLIIPVLVETPWWQTWWFRSLVIAAIATMVSALFTYRLQQIKSRQALRLGIAGRLHDDIGANLNAVAFKADAMAFTAIDEAKRQKYLEDISRMAREAVEKVRENVWVVHSKYDTLPGVVSKMRDTLDDMLGGTVKSVFEAPEGLPETPVRMELRQDIYLLYKEILQNVAKHAKARSVRVDVHYSAPNLRLIVRDDGMGFEPENPDLGNGLDLMRQRAERHRGVLTFRSTPGQGTTVELSIRIR